MRKFYIVAGVLFVFAAAGFYFLPRPQSGPQSSGETATSTPREVVEGLYEYQNEEYGFTLLYPKDLVVAEHDEGGGAMTITFENTETLEGFQIFIVPFSGDQITDERFKQDVPSGVRKGLQEITVDGAVGASFYSENEILGETAEVWFLHNGYLYEVNTFKELDNWLGQILQTWQFSEENS